MSNELSDKRIAAALECAEWLCNPDERDDMIDRILDTYGIETSDRMGVEGVVRAWFISESHIYCTACAASMEDEEIEEEIQSITDSLIALR